MLPNVFFLLHCGYVIPMLAFPNSDAPEKSRLNLLMAYGKVCIDFEEELLRANDVVT